MSYTLHTVIHLQKLLRNDLKGFINGSHSVQKVDENRMEGFNQADTSVHFITSTNTTSDQSMTRIRCLEKDFWKKNRNGIPAFVASLVRRENACQKGLCAYIMGSCSAQSPRLSISITLPRFDSGD